MRIVLLCLLLVLTGRVWAMPGTPRERPPEDFAGTQYIDSAGCVFLRQGSVWTPRLDRDGTVICGYPPSLPAPGPQPDDGSAHRLALTLAEGLQDGDLREDPTDELLRQPVETPRLAGEPAADLGAAVGAIPALRAAMADPQAGDGQLCDLLGYPSSAVASGGSGATLGICAGAPTELRPNERKTQTARTTMSARDSAQKPKARPAPRAVAASSGNRRARPAGLPPPVKANGAADRGVATAEMVPAGARYVQVGSFSAPARSEAAIRRLAGLGYPVARSIRSETATGGRLIMVGPFDDRRAVIAALNHLRKTGYPGAFAR